MLTSRTKDLEATDRAKDAGAVAPPICRRLFTIEQAADFAGVPVRVICRWIKTRKLETHLLGSRVRIDEVELADLLTSPDSKRP